MPVIQGHFTLLLLSAWGFSGNIGISFTKSSNAVVVTGIEENASHAVLSGKGNQSVAPVCRLWLQLSGSVGISRTKCRLAVAVLALKRVPVMQCCHARAMDLLL